MTNDNEPSMVAASNDMAALSEIVAAFRRLDTEAQQRVFDAVATMLGLRAASHRPTAISTHESRTTNASAPSFTEDRSISPKEFLLQKQPKTDVYRVACLAYYLTHYRDMPHFKTLEISKLNTEAAQPKFTNAAKAVANATLLGYLAPATKGNKQISGLGERFVLALPDLEAAKAVLVNAKSRKRPKRSSGKKSQANLDGKA